MDVAGIILDHLQPRGPELVNRYVSQKAPTNYSCCAANAGPVAMNWSVRMPGYQKSSSRKCAVKHLLTSFHLFAP
jgi:hypothetical protein